MTNLKTLAVFILCAVTFTVILSYSLDRHFDAMIHERMNFQGWGPFTMARVLSPICISIVKQVVPSERTSALIYIAVCTSALLYAFSRHLHLTTGIGAAGSRVYAVILLIPLLWNYVILSAAHYPGDIAAILLFTLGLNALIQKRKILFHIILLVALMNRESSIFLIPAMFLIDFKKRPMTRLIFHCLALVISAAALRLWLIHLVNATDVSQPNLFDQYFLSNIHFLKSAFSGNPQALRMLMTFGGLWILIPLAFRNLNSAQKRLLILFPVFFAGMLIVGNMNNEARIFNEMVPIVTVPAVITIKRWFA